MIIPKIAFFLLLSELFPENNSAESFEQDLEVNKE